MFISATDVDSGNKSCHNNSQKYWTEYEDFRPRIPLPESSCQGVPILTYEFPPNKQIATFEIPQEYFNQHRDEANEFYKNETQLDVSEIDRQITSDLLIYCYYCRKDVDIVRYDPRESMEYKRSLCFRICLILMIVFEVLFFVLCVCFSAVYLGLKASGDTGLENTYYALWIAFFSSLLVFFICGVLWFFCNPCFGCGQFEHYERPRGRRYQCSECESLMFIAYEDRVSCPLFTGAIKTYKAKHPRFEP
ncbi:unnamed protein product [Moneuplotes crassus]|uniref:Uncharacterized protein n=1 Tax=Euplotes crassus TaxID=5936 RepID=A0AAD1XSK9_EUPCR|nr:unnamed protein product [Moneuplotes crassus]